MAVLVARPGINEPCTLCLPRLRRIASCPCCLYYRAAHTLHGTLPARWPLLLSPPTREVHACHPSRSIAKPYLLPCLVRSWAKENTIEASFHLFIFFIYFLVISRPIRNSSCDWRHKWARPSDGRTNHGNLMSFIIIIIR
jgi:hypothetical protein